MEYTNNSSKLLYYVLLVIVFYIIDKNNDPDPPRDKDGCEDLVSDKRGPGVNHGRSGE